MAEWLSALPVWWANVLTVGLFAGIAIGTLRVPKKTIFEGAPDRARWRDIRLWALALIACQLAIYALF